MSILHNEAALGLQVDRLQASKSVEDAWEFFIHLMNEYGFQYCSYGFFTQPVYENCLREAVYYSTLPKGYIDLFQRYTSEKENYLNLHWAQGERAYRWLDPDNRLRKTQGAASIEKEFMQMGQLEGVTIPYRSHQNMVVGGVSLCMDGPNYEAFTDLWEKEEEKLLYVGAVLHQFMVDARRVNAHFGLTSREKECLYWSMAGLSSKQIGYELAIAQKTTEHHLHTATRKLRARNKTHAVSRAMSLGILKDQSYLPRDWLSETM